MNDILNWGFIVVYVLLLVEYFDIKKSVLFLSARLVLLKIYLSNKNDSEKFLNILNDNFKLKNKYYGEEAEEFSKYFIKTVIMLMLEDIGKICFCIMSIFLVHKGIFCV